MAALCLLHSNSLCLEKVQQAPVSDSASKEKNKLLQKSTTFLSCQRNLEAYSPQLENAQHFCVNFKKYKGEKVVSFLHRDHFSNSTEQLLKTWYLYIYFIPHIEGNRVAPKQSWGKKSPINPKSGWFSSLLCRHLAWNTDLEFLNMNHCFLCFGWIIVTLMEVLQLWHSARKEHLELGKSWVVSFCIWECKHTMSNSELSPSSRQMLSKVSVQFLTRPSSVSRQLLKSSSCRRLNCGEYWKFTLVTINYTYSVYKKEQ